MPVTIDPAVLGFTLDVHAARTALGLSSVAEVYALARAGLLATLRVRAQVWFHAAEVRQYAEIRGTERQEIVERTVARGLGVLQDYLTSLEPAESYDDALRHRLPLFARTRGGEAVFVRIDAITRWHNDRDEVQMLHVPSIVAKTVEDALVRVGAVRTRGMVALADADRPERVQRWTMWWRLPDGLFTDTVPDVAPADERPGDAVKPVQGEAHVV